MRNPDTNQRKCEEVFQVYGVRHSDERNSEEILNRTPSPVDEIFHEQVDPDEHQLWHLLMWVVATPSNTLATILRAVGNTRHHSECEKAAHKLAEREGIEVEYIGMNYLERTKVVFPLHTLVWAPTVYAVIQRPGLVIQGILITSFLIIFSMRLTEIHEIWRRDAHMSEQIISKGSQTGRSVVVIGQDHLSGVCGKLAEDGNRMNTIPLLNELNEE